MQQEPVQCVRDTGSGNLYGDRSRLGMVFVRVENIHGGVGSLACLYSWVGEPRVLQAVCLSPCLCMAHVMALAPQRGTQRGTCPLARLSACLSSEKPLRV